MKQLVGHDQGNYTFVPSTGAITIYNLNNNVILAEEQILIIVEETNNNIIYNFADPSKNDVSYANNVITLPTSVTSSLPSNTPLVIYVDIPTTAPNDQAAMIDNYTHILLERICDLLEPMATQDQQNRQRVSIDAIVPNVVIGSGTVTTLGTVTNPVPIGNVATWGPTPGGNIEWQMVDWARQAYESGIRSQLTFGN